MDQKTGRKPQARPAVVIGAGPYGLSAAAHLRQLGVPVRVFGDPMVSWRENMPPGMLLKSTPAASNISAPWPGHTLLDYCVESGERRYESDWDLVPAETFARYGEWFQRTLLPDLTRTRIVSVDPTPDGGFEVKADSGEFVEAGAVVVATGLAASARMPRPLAAAAAVDGGTAAGALVSHSGDHGDLGHLAGRELLVVGAGQSGLETAVLAAEAGASVRVVARRASAVGFGAPPDHQPRLRPDSPFGRAWSLHGFTYYADAYRYLPAPIRSRLAHRVLGPLGAWWLRERFMASNVGVTQGHALVRADRVDGGSRIALRLGGGRRLEADHVVSATGYRTDLGTLGFLSAELRARLVPSGRDTSPLLGPGFVSSVPGLYFTGLPAAASYGPVMRFVVGTEFASPRLAAAVAGRYGG